MRWMLALLLALDASARAGAQTTCALPTCAKGDAGNLVKYRATLQLFPNKTDDFNITASNITDFTNQTVKWGVATDETTCIPHAFDQVIKPSADNPFVPTNEGTRFSAPFRAFNETFFRIYLESDTRDNNDVFVEANFQWNPASEAAQRCRLLHFFATRSNLPNGTAPPRGRCDTADTSVPGVCADTDSESLPLPTDPSETFLTNVEAVIECCDICPGSRTLPKNLTSFEPVLCPAAKNGCIAPTEKIDGILSAREVSAGDLLVELPASTALGTPRIALASQQACLRRLGGLSVVNFYHEECFFRPTHLSTRSQVRLYHSWRCAAARAAAPHVYARPFEVGIDSKSALKALPHATKKLDAQCHLQSWKPGADKMLTDDGIPRDGYGRVAVDVSQLLAELVCGVQGLTTIAHDLAADVVGLQKKYAALKGVLYGAAGVALASGFGVVTDAGTVGLAYGKAAEAEGAGEV